LWVLKSSPLLETAKILGIQNALKSENSSTTPKVRLPHRRTIFGAFEA